MNRSCNNCKHKKEQSYTGYSKPRMVECKHPKHEQTHYFIERHLKCEDWEGVE